MCNDNPNLARYNKIVESFHNESDRAAAILAASFLEDFLTGFLRKFMVDDSQATKNMLQGFGPLATFSARRECAYVFGYIDDSLRKDLKVIAKVRNEFAHNYDRNSFSDSPIANLCANLSTATCSQAPRSQYLMAISMTVGRLHNIMYFGKG